MNELITTLTNATPEQYFFALVVLFGVERKMVPEAGIEPARQQ